MHSLTKSSLGACVAAASLLGAVGVTNPVSVAAAEPMRVASKAKPAQREDVETRIKTLHSQLRITAEQETAWQNVAGTMRDNARMMADLRSQQAEKERSASAPDVINAYGKTTDAHADAIKKFSAAFQPLYDGMSAAQKKTADEVFRYRVHEAAKKAKS